MQQNRIEGEQALLASILTRRPDFGSAGYLSELPPQPSLIELLERIHTPTHPGPGPAQRP